MLPANILTTRPSGTCDRVFILTRAGRLTRYTCPNCGAGAGRTWRGPGGETLGGTNNFCERGIGGWIKERYRSMRGYKRHQSAVNVSRPLA